MYIICMYRYGYVWVVCVGSMCVFVGWMYMYIIHVHCMYVYTCRYMYGCGYRVVIN